MKKIFVLSVMLFFPFCLFAQGIVFEKGSFAQALEKAKIENKLLFVDVYTDWCGPCKQMSANVFTQDEVGSVFNRSFVSIKIDAENGEGVEIAKQLQVTAYPTMFFINPQTGKPIHRMLGFRDAEKLLDEVRQFEKSAKYDGPEQMKADFAEGRNDIEFLTDLFKLLPANDPMRSVIAERYLLHVPAETFKSEERDTIIFIGEDNGILVSLNRWNDEAMQRVLDLLDEKLREESKDGQFSANYSIGVVFGVELTVGNIMRKAIDSGDEQMLEQTIRFQQEFRRRLDRIPNGDGDYRLMSGRRLFFASPRLLRLEFLAVNNNDPERFKTEAVSFMNELMTTMPIESMPAIPDPQILLIVEQNPEAARMLIPNRIREKNMSIQIITGWANHYWRLMPNDKATKDTVAAWLNYAAALNPLYLAEIKNMVPLFLKIGHRDDAIRHLENSLEIYRSVKLDMPNFTGGVQEMIDDIRNDKI